MAKKVDCSLGVLCLASTPVSSGENPVRNWRKRVKVTAFCQMSDAFPLFPLFRKTVTSVSLLTKQLFACFPYKHPHRKQVEPPA